MYARKRKLSDSQEPACVLCGSVDYDLDTYGRMFDQIGFRVHEFCLIFANISFDETPTDQGTVHLDYAALTTKVKQANQKQCCVCGERGAAITCTESGCERSFHLPCAKDGQCVTQFFGLHRSYCFEHCPRQTAVTASATGTRCAICQETVGNIASYHTLMCSVCKHAWFHRDCIQQQALNDGKECFRCPVCQDNALFCIEMSILGIRIPDSVESFCQTMQMRRTPAWEDERAFATLQQRHRCCDAIVCFYHGGRELAEEEGLTWSSKPQPPCFPRPWQLILCSSCGVESTHRQCSYSSIRMNMWDCDRCAGLGTASAAISELAALSTASQQSSLEPSHSPQEHEHNCSSPDSQAASEPSHRSQLPQLSCQTSELGTTCSHGPDHQDTVEQHQAQHGSSHTPTPATESSSRISTRRSRSGSSRAATAAARRRRPRQRRTSRTRSRSPLQGRAPGSQSPTRRPRGSRRTPSPAAQNRTRSTTRAARRRSSRAPLHSHPAEWPGQTGEARMQSRSSVAQRATYVLSRCRRGCRRKPQQQRLSRP
ncbi:PHD finger protein 7-like [Lagopus muta]|uniref:PHD finger protein 7-like n=1 Tax=Lagopus muta TaxID=64668 RepID=UPI00209E1210|nr:PHD finger protein 7-like [Lagopus muta]